MSFGASKRHDADLLIVNYHIYTFEALLKHVVIGKTVVQVLLKNQCDG
jgi:hypothetical protein